MAPTTETPAQAEPIGHLVRQWRTTRGLSQLALAELAEVSTRHISFVENGKAAPSREMVLVLASALDVPLRERNRLLLAAGFAPVYREEPLGAPQSPHMGELRRVLELVLGHHDPFPAIVVDARWQTLAMNAGAHRVVAAFVDDPQVIAEVGSNAMHLVFHPRGLRPHLVNWHEIVRVTVERLRHEIVHEPGGPASALLEELRRYGPLPGAREIVVGEPRLLIPVHLRRGELELRFFTTLASLGTPIDVTANELRIETYYPCDDATAAWARAAVG